LYCSMWCVIVPLNQYDGDVGFSNVQTVHKFAG